MPPSTRPTACLLGDRDRGPRAEEKTGGAVSGVVNSQELTPYLTPYPERQTRENGVWRVMLRLVGIPPESLHDHVREQVGAEGAVGILAAAPFVLDLGVDGVDATRG